jgi:hypothetical protein
MKISEYKNLKNYLIALSQLSSEMIENDTIWYAGFMWLQLNNKQIYDLIDTFKDTRLIIDIDSDGEDKYYYLPKGTILIDNRDRRKGGDEDDRCRCEGLLHR